MILVLASVVFVLAITLANLSVAAFGPASMAVNAFVLIGLDLALRDWMHARVPPWLMGVLILVGGALTFALSPQALQVAAASAGAFTVSACVDWLVFSALRRRSLAVRSNGSNLAGAAVDSALFPLFAGFGMQWAWPLFFAKVAGGAVWSWLLMRSRPKL